jgi:hypothetical protein
MNRTVPRATSAEIELYRSTLYSLLRSTAEVKIRTLEGVHTGMNSLMHPLAKEIQPDISALVYSIMRLPDCMADVRLVLLGQNSDVLHRNGFLNVESWQSMSARARRRRCYFNGKDTLACYIASRSDIEDVIPTLTAYQIEWNKIHQLLVQWPRGIDLAQVEKSQEHFSSLCALLQVSQDDLERLKVIWGASFSANLKAMQRKECSISIRLLGGSFAQYMKATHEWFENVRSAFPEITARPVYFVSSNTHSIINVITGFALQHAAELETFLQGAQDSDLNTEWNNILLGNVRASRENFLYYTLKKYQNTLAGFPMIQAQLADEQQHGILRINPANTFEVEAQIFNLNRINPATIDSRLTDGKDLSFLADSDAVVLNIDYPLGLAAYNILSMVSIHTDLRGIFSMGKSASLNAARGDVIIPNICQDEHSHNTYLFDNAFIAADVIPYLKYGSVLDNQKAVCVLGTFLQNAHIMDIFFSESFGDVEMELGNFCSALYEATRPKRYPVDEIVNLHGMEIEFGILHYVSDTPMSKGKNLGAGTLSYFGMDSTYACSIAIMEKIIELERRRLESR